MGDSILESQQPAEVATIMAGKVVLVDMDNTLVDWDCQFYNLMTKLHPHVPLRAAEARINWSIEYNYPLKYERAILELTDQPEFWRTMPPMKGGVDAMQGMVARGLNVFIVSSPDPFHTSRCAKEKYDWIEYYLGPHWKSKVILASDKTLIRGDVLIDDKPSVCYGAHVPLWTHVLYHHPYNSMYTSKPRIQHWTEWEQVLEDVVTNHASYHNNQFRCLQESQHPLPMLRMREEEEMAEEGEDGGSDKNNVDSRSVTATTGLGIHYSSKSSSLCYCNSTTANSNNLLERRREQTGEGES
eukprot:GHVS01041341.1.p1 GENE.GHVS01041341.1~~GHVS01041341.1.p1  ORF type:complete len:299 (-),score=42.17 GHVS01041341.1:241-1137(-)